jgi:hypothetical protein
MEKLVLDGKVFVKASSAADALGYTPDYIGQLCRAEKIEAHLVGRSWYVNQEQLRLHKIDKKRSVKAKAREQIQNSVREAAEANEARHIGITEDKRAYEHRIKYEVDEGELMPQVKKLAVNDKKSTKKQSKKKKHTSHKKETDDLEPGYTVENEGNKIIMSGKLDVVDATDEASLDPATTTLHAKVVTTKPPVVKPRRKRHIKETKAISAISDSEQPTRQTVDTTSTHTQNQEDAGGRLSAFEEKLVQLNADRNTAATMAENAPFTQEQHAAGTAPKSPHVEGTERRIGKSDAFLYGLLAICIVLAFLSMTLEAKWLFTTPQDGGVGTVSTHWNINVRTATTYITHSL